MGNLPLIDSLFNCFRCTDPIKLYHINDRIDKLQIPIEILLDQPPFRPSLVTCPPLFEGHGQTIMAELKEKFYRAFFKSRYAANKDEIFKLKDGGQMCVAFKFHEAVDEIAEKKSKRPIMFLIPGYTGDKTKLYVANAMNTSYDKGFDVILINHRGLGGIQITTPKLYSAGS